MPRLPPSTDSHLSKLFNSATISTLTGVYGAAWTTLVAINVGSRLLSIDFYHDDTIHNMKVSAASMAAVGMLSLPYQYIPDLPSFDHILFNHPYWVLHLGFEVPIILPLIINKMTRENDFSEWRALALGGVIMQLLTLGLIYLIFNVGLNNDRFLSFLDYIAHSIFPPDPDDLQHGHAHAHHPNCRHARRQRHQAEQLPRHESFFDALIKQSLTRVRKLQAIVSNVANPRRIIQNIDIVIPRSVFNYLQATRDSIKRDIYMLFYNPRVVFAANENIVETATEALKTNTTTNLLLLPQQVDGVLREVVTPQDSPTILSKPVIETMVVTDIELDLDEKEVAVTPPLPVLAVSGVERKKEKPHIKSNKNKYQKKRPPHKKPPQNPVEQAKPNPQEKNERKLSDVIRENSAAKPTEKPRLKLSDLRLVKTVFSHTPAKEESVQPLKVAECMQVQLTEFEKMVFAFLEMLVAKKDHQYKTYIVGGWAYDKVREFVLGIPPCQYNDIDLVTEIPPNLLGGILNKIHQVKGLFCGTLHKIKMDVVHVADLSDLSGDVNNRDFMLFYIDKSGKVSDPTQLALTNLRLGKLDEMKPPELMFKEDPLVMLRAIYEGSKRNLNYENLKSVMTTDVMALVPRNFNINGEPETILNPHRMNLRIGNLFSQHFAAKNFAILCELGFFGVLYPAIYIGMIAGLDWIKQQMDIIVGDPKPNLAFIYATFIAPTIVHQNPVLSYDSNDDRTKFDEDILRLVKAAGNTSLLFQDAFKNPHELYNELRWPLKMYRKFYLDKLLTVTPEVPVFAGMRNC